MEGGCEIYPPPAASELALPSDNSKHDCTGEKFILVPEYLTERRMMAHFKEEEPRITVTLSFFFCNLLLEFFKIDLKSLKIAKILNFLNLNLT